MSVEGCADGRRARRLHTGASVAALVLLRDSLCKSMPGELTRMWVNATDERKWHRGAVQALMKANLFSMPDVDTCLAKACLLTLTQCYALPLM